MTVLHQISQLDDWGALLGGGPLPFCIAYYCRYEVVRNSHCTSWYFGSISSRCAWLHVSMRRQWTYRLKAGLWPSMLPSGFWLVWRGLLQCTLRSNGHSLYTVYIGSGLLRKLALAVGVLALLAVKTGRVWMPYFCTPSVGAGAPPASPSNSWPLMYGLLVLSKYRHRLMSLMSPSVVPLLAVSTPGTCETQHT